MNGKLVFGVGVYEKGKHQARKSGKDSKPYKAWAGMLGRCCNEACQEKHRDTNPYQKKLQDPLQSHLLSSFQDQKLLL